MKKLLFALIMLGAYCGPLVCADDINEVPATERSIEQQSQDTEEAGNITIAVEIATDMEDQTTVLAQMDMRDAAILHVTAQQIIINFIQAPNNPCYPGYPCNPCQNPCYICPDDPYCSYPYCYPCYPCCYPENQGNSVANTIEFDTDDLGIAAIMDDSPDEAVILQAIPARVTFWQSWQHAVRAIYELLQTKMRSACGSVTKSQSPIV